MTPEERLAQINRDLEALSTYSPNFRFKSTERYSLAWTDPRVVFATPHLVESMTVSYCKYYQRDTPHGDGVCIYHKAGECR
jgi:hypothetical protein